MSTMWFRNFRKYIW